MMWMKRLDLVWFIIKRILSATAIDIESTCFYVSTVVMQTRSSLLSDKVIRYMIEVYYYLQRWVGSGVGWTLSVQP